jgi:hypothetical protein
MRGKGRLGVRWVVGCLLFSGLGARNVCIHQIYADKRYIYSMLFQKK